MNHKTIAKFDPFAFLTSGRICGISVGTTRDETRKILGIPQHWQEGFDVDNSPIWEYDDMHTGDDLQIVFAPTQDIASMALSISTESVVERPVVLSKCLQTLANAGIHVRESQANHAHYLEFGDATATFLGVYFNDQGDEFELTEPALRLLKVGNCGRLISGTY
ncbi:MAG: hypothetical protein KDB00_07120 [Planctomycetales bacterium]|nr:hypothetical protein [Planctomycetales bacterium]